MKIMKKVLLLAVTGLMILQTACSDNSNKAQNGVEHEIAMDEFNIVLEQYKTRYKQQAGEEAWETSLKDNKEFIASLEELVLEQIILEKVLMHEATEAKLEITDEELNSEIEKAKKSYETEDGYSKFLEENNYTEETFNAEMKKQLLLTKYLKSRAEEIMKIEPTDKELEELYNQYASAFKKVKASHILVLSEEEAKDIKSKLDGGGDFSELAKEYSTCPSSADGGDLGYFAANEMVKEFSSAAFAMSVDEISEPVKSEFGYHIIKVTDVVDTFEKTNKEDIIYQYRALKYDEMINGFTNEADVKIPKELEEIRKRSKVNM